MLGILLYCRPGFENDCANEIQDKAGALNVFGFIKTQRQSGYVFYQCYNPEDVLELAKGIDYSQLIFARQMIAVKTFLKALPLQDRITPILDAMRDLPMGGDLYVETPEGDETKPLLTFCRKFTVPLRQALKKQNILTAKENRKKICYHLCFLDNQSTYIGYSLPQNRNEQYMGIMRLRFPSEAPSRSTLKLEEALHTFLTAEEREERFKSGMHAVDLGACPGGWTYQLVRQGMFVSCVDNGAMAQSLMDSGQVKHFMEDGFKFEPERKNIDWLVCDMIEKPKRVAQLMAKWLVEGWCKETIFNLKLPMKKRYQEAQQDIKIITDILEDAGIKYQLQAKQLYHDREEISVHISLLGNVWGKQIGHDQ
ncbi:23S rRNA (cytidine(2498)-2'-O)-methyltransferase RlmM [Psychromonas sp. CD1]|uniref:23S rRNA (cytidine(2498)-2'-O)-methyltransferase RlmM n=1 Tax=Psychromonas sp. CD1 TaxID=1979839 RepID=UPI000B9BD559|nr:23S rRNA (cytidine(2498)-2'-O)-methyltransferase RlmM [Psychromonas sp. CD1]